MIRVDNLGAIFMAGIITAARHVKHVDIRYTYGNKYVEDRIAKIVLVKSVGYDSAWKI